MKLGSSIPLEGLHVRLVALHDDLVLSLGASKCPAKRSRSSACMGRLTKRPRKGARFRAIRSLDSERAPESSKNFQRFHSSQYIGWDQHKSKRKERGPTGRAPPTTTRCQLGQMTSAASASWRSSEPSTVAVLSATPKAGHDATNVRGPSTGSGQIQ